MLDPISLKLVCFSSTFGPVIEFARTLWTHPKTITEEMRSRQEAKGRHGFVFQGDGNAVFEFYAPHVVYWASNTANTGKTLQFTGAALEIRSAGNIELSKMSSSTHGVGVR